jgi:hypothetical protein
VRALWVDLLAFLLPLLLGAAAFAAGAVLKARGSRLRYALAAAAVVVVAGGGLAVAGRLPLELYAAVSRVGGGTVLVSWAALALLGIAWKAPKRTFSRGFMAALAAVAGVLIALESGGRLWWRFGAPEAWARTADDDGLIRQTSGMSCSPAAAVMLLHRHGVKSSEGEMAYLAGTGPFGTDAHAMARALTEKLRPGGRAAVVRRGGYEDRVRDGPFIAHVRLPGGGGHALLVERLSANWATVSDPADGQQRLVPRPAFEAMWDGTAILVTGPGS